MHRTSVGRAFSSVIIYTLSKVRSSSELKTYIYEHHLITSKQAQRHSICLLTLKALGAVRTFDHEAPPKYLPPPASSIWIAHGAARTLDFRWITSTIAGQSIQVKFANSRIYLASQHIIFNSEVLQVAQLTDVGWYGTGKVVVFETDLGEGRQIEDAGG